jgi:ubiquinone/menaquinone biosynthesis C-methylase UbiE
MAGRRMDYDRIGARYDDEAVRQRDADPVLMALCHARGHSDGAGVRVLDIACGTGIQLVANARRLPGLVQWGLDLHEAMLRAAQAKAGAIGWIGGDGAALPFADASFDFVSAQYCFHHVEDKPAMLRGAARVLRPGGQFALVNIAPWRMPDWEVYRYFPGAFMRDAVDFWREDRIAAELARHGLSVEIAYRDQRRAYDLRERLAFYKERYSPSQVVALSDADFAAGIRRIEAALAASGGRKVTSVSHSCIATICASKA